MLEHNKAKLYVFFLIVHCKVHEYQETRTLSVKFCSTFQLSYYFFLSLVLMNISQGIVKASNCCL